jgi:hypothetical protein
MCSLLSNVEFSLKFRLSKPTQLLITFRNVLISKLRVATFYCGLSISEVTNRMCS